MNAGLKGYCLGLFTRFLGMSADEASEACDAALAEFRRRDVHTYSSQYICPVCVLR